MSLIGAITPLGQVAGDNKLRLRCIAGSTIAGSLSAGATGALLGFIGRLLSLESWQRPLAYFIGLLALLLAAREWGWIRFPLPERKRQTEKYFAHSFGFVTASWMWGFHIGFGFFTRITFGGFWVLVAAAIGSGSPGYGAVLMVVYWLGRMLPVWVAPSLGYEGGSSGELLEKIVVCSPVHHRVTGFGLLFSAGIVMLFAFQELLPAFLRLAAWH